MFSLFEAPGGQSVSALGIPFQVVKEGPRVLPLPERIPLSGRYQCAYFLGMSVKDWMCSEWWGQREVTGDYSLRLFIGDLVAKIHIDYADGTQDSMPVLFGVNCWNYNLFFKPQPWEDAGQSFEAPYDEPMRSDGNARELFEASLRMLLNDDPDAQKATRWVFAYRLRPDRELEGIRFESVKAQGVEVGGVTLSTEEPVLPAVDEWFFLRKGWFSAADALARRLYQYRDELPETVEPLPLPAGLPDLRFTGCVEADIYTNVYRVNLDDMRANKVTDDGMPHTSSACSVNFGCYVGMGTFTPSASYASHVWTRDTGRLLIELIHFGCGKRALSTADKLHEMLYLPSRRFPVPHWKRIANRTFEDSGDMSNEGKENDGHASIMMFICSLYQAGIVDDDWLRNNEEHLRAAADFFLWQMNHPDQSNYRGVLFSESEASSQERGGYDLYSNVISAYALNGYGALFHRLGKDDYAARLEEASRMLLEGVDERFVLRHPRCGDVYTDTNDDCWTYEYKRFCHALMHCDMVGYDLSEDDPALFDRLQRTFDAQKEAYYHPESGRQMGYGQGYLTLTALMLDRQAEYSDCMDAVAHLCYHHTDLPYVVPEGVIMDPQRKRWYRNCDLGNAVQQAEIVKCARLLAGIDDLDPSRPLRVLPRLPERWSGIRADHFPVRLPGGKNETVSLRYTRCNGVQSEGITAMCADKGYNLKLDGADFEWARLGPFPTSEVAVSGGVLWKVKEIDHCFYAYVRGKASSC